ncbi:unnamed protein product [Lymnaea stagnalis]|uniref:Uncharacterized protein n=1 Tax=Lymnaea stagnalis TaxID=6523 RepID=A0AAV2I8D1_LYMST
MARLLVDAIQNGDTASAKDIIQTASYGCVDGQSWRRDGTALFFCCSRGYLELATALIAKGADVNATDKSLATPLHGAVDNGHVTIVKLLLEHGATVNSQTSRGDSPLHLSAYRGHQEITQCLVEAGADRGLVNVSNLTAQREAFSRGHTDVSNYLMAIEDATLPEVDHRLHSMIQLDPPNDLDVSTPPGRRQQTKSTVSRCEAKEEARVVKSAPCQQSIVESQRQCHTPCQQSIAESQRQCHTDESMNEIFLLHDSRQIYLTIDQPVQECPHTPSAAEGHPHTPSTTTHVYTQDSAKYQVSTRTLTSPQAHPRTPTSPQVHPHTPTSPQVHPHTPTSPQVHPLTATSPPVYPHGHKTPWVYPQFPTSPQVYPHTPTSPQVYPHYPTSPQDYPHYPTSSQDYPHYPTSPQPYPHSPTSPQAYPHIPPTAQVNPHRPKLQNSSTQTTWDMSLLSETDEKQNCQSVNGRCPPFSGHTYLNTRLSSGSVTDISSGSAEADIWSFLSSESETGDCFDIAPRRNSHPYSDSCNKDGFDTGSKEVKHLCEILGVRYPPDHGYVKSPKPSPLTDFSNILDVSLFSLSTLSSAPPSVSPPPFYANSLTANHFKNSLKTCRATSVNGPADDSPAARPVFNKSFSVEPRPLRGPRHSLKGSSLHFERLPPNDLSGSYVSVSSIAPKTSSMTCINIPLN